MLGAFGGNKLFAAATLYGTTTAFAAVWVAIFLPVQAGTVGPYNYHRVIKAGRRIPWRRLPKVV